MVLYVYVNYKFKISTEINQVVDTVLKRLKNKIIISLVVPDRFK
jgi:hypothetical protein